MNVIYALNVANIYIYNMPHTAYILNSIIYRMYIVYMVYITCIMHMCNIYYAHSSKCG